MQLAGFDRHYANLLGIENGRLAGTVIEPIFGRASKRTTLIALRDELGLAPKQTLAVGDGANDLAMLEEAGLGVAFPRQARCCRSGAGADRARATSPRCSSFRVLRAKSSATNLRA